MEEVMEIELYYAYASHWDNIEFPIYQLSDGTYICIEYSSNHKVYSMGTYTKEEFIEQGFIKYEDYNYLFEDLTKDMLGIN